MFGNKSFWHKMTRFCNNNKVHIVYLLRWNVKCEDSHIHLETRHSPQSIWILKLRISAFWSKAIRHSPLLQIKRRKTFAYPLDKEILFFQKKKKIISKPQSWALVNIFLKLQYCNWLTGQHDDKISPNYKMLREKISPNYKMLRENISTNLRGNVKINFQRNNIER